MNRTAGNMVPERSCNVTDDTPRAFTTTYLSWMMPYAVLVCTQTPEEQGEWVGASAIAILEGFPINDIAVVINRKYETWVNPQLLERSGLRLNAHITSGARKYN